MRTTLRIIILMFHLAIITQYEKREKGGGKEGKFVVVFFFLE